MNQFKALFPFIAALSVFSASNSEMYKQINLDRLVENKSKLFL